MRTLLPLLAALLLAASAAATPPEGEDTALVVYDVAIGQRGGHPAYLLSTAAAAPVRHNLSVYAQRELYSTAQGSEVFGFESGAALRLRQDVDLIARYRILGHESLSNDRDSEMSAPLIGVALRF
jgi:hypothetical protein